MTPDQKELVRSSWQKVVPIADTAADLFYNRLFEIDPSLRQLFKHADLAAQKKKLLQALATAIANLDKLDELVPQLEELGRRHVTYDVVKSDYDSVGAALICTLQKGLGDDWTPEMESAWSAVYGVVAQTMKAGAAKHQNQRP